jgi:hypothetical protein
VAAKWQREIIFNKNKTKLKLSETLKIKDKIGGAPMRS